MLRGWGLDAAGLRRIRYLFTWIRDLCGSQFAVFHFFLASLGASFKTSLGEPLKFTHILYPPNYIS